MIGDILQPTHLLFILVVALLVLGPKRLPEAGRALGRGIRDFRAAIEARTTAPERIRRAGRPPAGIFARQQLRALIELPARRLLGQI